MTFPKMCNHLAGRPTGKVTFLEGAPGCPEACRIASLHHRHAACPRKWSDSLPQSSTVLCTVQLYARDTSYTYSVQERSVSATSHDFTRRAHTHSGRMSDVSAAAVELHCRRHGWPQAQAACARHSARAQLTPQRAQRAVRKAVKHAARFQSLTPFARGAGSQQVGQRFVFCIIPNRESSSIVCTNSWLRQRRSRSRIGQRVQR